MNIAIKDKIVYLKSVAITEPEVSWHIQLKSISSYFRYIFNLRHIYVIYLSFNCVTLNSTLWNQTVYLTIRFVK